MGTGTFTPIITPAGYHRCGLSGKTGTTQTGLAVQTQGYQECGLSGKSGASATGLSTTTQYYFKVTKNGGTVAEYNITTAGTVTYTAVMALMNAAVTGMTFSIVGGDLRCTSALTGATSAIDLAAGTTGTDLFATLTGFTSFDVAVAGVTSKYYFKVSKDRGALTEVFINVLDDGTYAAVIALMNAAVAASAAIKGAVFSLDSVGDLKCISNTGGPHSAIVLAAGQATDLFATLTSFAAFRSPVAGTEAVADATERYIHYSGSFESTPGDSTYNTGGLVASFAGVVPHSSPPVWVKVQSNGAPGGSDRFNTYVFVPGTSFINGKVLISTTNGGAGGQQALEEVTDETALNDATILANKDLITFRASFRKGR